MLMNRLIEDERSSRQWTDISFFILGAATTITWDSIYMSVSYFQQFLGKQAGSLEVRSMQRHSPWFMAYPFVNIPPWIYPNSNGLRHQHHQQPILPDLEQVRKASDRSCRCCRFVSVFHSLWPLVERTKFLGRSGRLSSGSADFDHLMFQKLVVNSPSWHHDVPAWIKLESQSLGRRILVIWGSSHCCLISPTHLGFEAGKL